MCGVGDAGHALLNGLLHPAVQLRGRPQLQGRLGSCHHGRIPAGRRPRSCLHGGLDNHALVRPLAFALPKLLFPPSLVCSPGHPRLGSIPTLCTYQIDFYSQLGVLTWTTTPCFDPHPSHSSTVFPLSLVCSPGQPTPHCCSPTIAFCQLSPPIFVLAWTTMP